MAAISTPSSIPGNSTLTSQIFSGFRERNNRQRARWPVSWRLDSMEEKGEVLDAYPKGLFLTAAANTSKGPERGDRVELSFFLAGSNEPVSVRGVVRRVGHSFAHDCEGWGIELEEPHYSLFNKLWQDHATQRAATRLHEPSGWHPSLY